MKIVLGMTTKVSLPEYKIFAIPARVDTGARRTAIWATHIKEEDGVLSWVFFGKSSAFYTGKTIKSSEYKIITVKNSFGKRESRYAVPLCLEFEGHEADAWISLSPSRSRNAYPVLLGRTELANNTLVNIRAKSKKRKAHQDVAVMFRVYGDKNIALFNKIARHFKSSEQLDLVRYKELVFSFDGLRTHTRSLVTDRDLRTYRLVYFRHKLSDSERAITLASYLDHYHVRFNDSELFLSMSQGKLSQYYRLALARLPLPKFIAAEAAQITGLLAKDNILDFPNKAVVVKEPKSDMGKNNYLVSNETELEQAMDELPEKGCLIAQEYIPNDGFWRIFVLGGKPVMAIFRSTTPHKHPLKAHLNKPAGGRNAKLVKTSKINPHILRAAMRASKVLSREIVGVDIVQNAQTGQFFILEVNDAPQMPGAFSEQKIKELAKYLDKGRY